MTSTVTPVMSFWGQTAAVPGEGCSSSGPRYSTLLTVRFAFKGPPKPPSRTVPSEQQPWVGEPGSWHRRLLDNATSGTARKTRSVGTWVYFDFFFHPVSCCCCGARKFYHQPSSWSHLSLPRDIQCCRHLGSSGLSITAAASLSAVRSADINLGTRFKSAFKSKNTRWLPDLLATLKGSREAEFRQNNYCFACFSPTLILWYMLPELNTRTVIKRHLWFCFSHKFWKVKAVWAFVFWWLRKGIRLSNDWKWLAVQIQPPS